MRGTERERNINVWLPVMCPLLGTWPPTQVGHMPEGPFGRISRGTLWFTGQHSFHWATPARASLFPVFKMENFWIAQELWSLLHCFQIHSPYTNHFYYKLSNGLKSIFTLITTFIIAKILDPSWVILNACVSASLLNSIFHQICMFHLFIICHVHPSPLTFTGPSSIWVLIISLLYLAEWLATCLEGASLTLLHY